MGQPVEYGGAKHFSLGVRGGRGSRPESPSPLKCRRCQRRQRGRRKLRVAKTLEGDGAGNRVSCPKAADYNLDFRIDSVLAQDERAACLGFQVPLRAARDMT